jgi:hypothetical protein
MAVDPSQGRLGAFEREFSFSLHNGHAYPQWRHRCFVSAENKKGQPSGQPEEIREKLST